MRPDHSRPPHHNDVHGHAHNEAGAGGRARAAGRPPRIGIGGPVGSGKTALVAALCRRLAGELSLAVVTNDIYTTEDAEFLRRAGVLASERIRAVQTGACPHTAIRDDISANLDAVEALEAEFADLDLVLVESGGDNLTATFSYGLIDRQIFVIDVSGGDKVPRKGGPGVTRSDLLVINKTDLAPFVGASLEVMDHDAGQVRAGRPVLFTSLVAPSGADAVADWVRAVRTELVAGMRRAARVEVGPGGRLVHLESGPPLTVRRVHHDAPGTCALTLVGSAAGPLPGDCVSLALSVGTGARVSVSAAGAAICQGRDGAPAQLRFDLDLADASDVDLALPPLVVCAGSRVASTVSVTLAPSAAIAIRETIVLGRTGEEGGTLCSGWDVTRGARPVLRQTVRLAPGDWIGVLAGARVLASAFVSRPGLAPVTRVADPTAVVQRIDDQTALATVLDLDAASAEQRLAALLSGLGGPAARDRG